MSKYVIRINCSYFEDIEVDAENEQEAIEQAEIKFNCAGGCPEFSEVLSTED